MKVSVCLIAYNHELYIEQAVRGILAQRTDFAYEIVVGEDCSTDQTLSILQDLQAQYPDRIHILPTDHNLGVIQNYIRTLQACHGEYVAILDGDDYWCAEDKLQKQVNFFDQHEDCTIVFHSVLKVYDVGSQQPKVIRSTNERQVFELDDLLTSMFIPTCSALFRNGLIGEFPDWSSSLKMLDWLIFIMLARYGKIGFIDDVMATYRVHSSGWWSSMESLKRVIATLGFFEKLDPYLKFEYSKTIRNTLERNWRKLMDELYDLAILQRSLEEAQARMNEWADSWAGLASIPRFWYKELWERVYCYFLMTNFENGDYAAAWSAWLKLMKNDPSLLLNRGLLLIGLESTCNGRWRPLIQKFTGSNKAKYP